MFDENLYYVYFIREKGSHYVKIGYANDPNKRLIELQIGNPHQMEVWVALQVTDRLVAERIEKTYHERYAGAKHRGEWYVLSDADLADVKLSVDIANEAAKAERRKWQTRYYRYAQALRRKGVNPLQALASSDHRVA